MISIIALLYGNNILNNQRIALDVQRKTLDNIVAVQTQVKDMIKTQHLVAQQELHDFIKNIQAKPAAVDPKWDKLLNIDVNTNKEKK